jgi:alcohol dehydrogenase class IV
LRALGEDDAAGALFDLAATHGAPTSLRQLGMSESDLDKAADEALRSAYWNPRPIERDPIRALLDDAYFGRRPS